MTIVDERGRLFGRFNLIDAAVLLVALVLIPVAYAAYVLFHPDPIRIVSVQPSRVTVGQTPRIRIHGEHLRPYLRAQVGALQPHTFLIESPLEGEMVLPELPAGTFDLTLYDEVREVARMKNAITVAPVPTGPRVSLRLNGSFFGLDDATAATLTVGRKFPNDPSAAYEIVETAAVTDDIRHLRPKGGAEAVISVPVAGSRQLPAVVRVTCPPTTQNQTCTIGDVTVVAGTTLTLAGGFLFAVDDVRADVPATTVVATVQFIGRPDAIDLIAVGDGDSDGPQGAARVVAVRNRAQRSGQFTRQTSLGRTVETATAPESFHTVDVDLRVMADQTPQGLAYQQLPLKPGAAFTFETIKYLVHGTVVAVTASTAK
jgi:hypothetical protein